MLFAICIPLDQPDASGLASSDGDDDKNDDDNEVMAAEDEGTIGKKATCSQSDCSIFKWHFPLNHSLLS